jgi:DNA repair photolyase
MESQMQPRELQTITRKTLLYKSGAVHDYALNHVEGCAHGCRYPCYAMMLKRRWGVIDSYEDWTRPKIVSNTLELLDKELMRLKDKLAQVYLCFSTDPFMYQVHEVQSLTLEILRTLRKQNLKAVTLSKGLYPDDLLDRETFGSLNEFGCTVVSLSEDFRKRFEPNAAPIKERIRELKKLHEAGFKTWVSMEPYPTPNVFKQDIREILSEISFVDRIMFGKWNYSRLTSSFLRRREFYDSMAHEVIKFSRAKSIDVHTKEGTISLPCAPSGASDDQAMLERHA